MTPAQLKAWRSRLALTQRAAAAKLGVSERCVRYWEAGQRPIPRMAELRMRDLEKQRLARPATSQR